jgi:branched-chain amino acid transport system permease protein
MHSFLLFNALINGVVVGAVYALIGCSLNVLYGVLRVVNFAHGEFVVGGAFLAYVLFQQFGLNPVGAAPVGFVAFFAAGAALYYLLMPRLAKSDDPETASFLMMYGVALMAAATMLMLFEADTRSIDYTFTPVSVKIGPVFVPTSRLVALAVNVAIVAALAWFLYRTLPGKALRAAIMNREAIQIVGVNLHRLSAGAFGLALGLAGATGALLAMVFPAFSPFSGPDYTLIGFIIIVLGGLGHPIGAVVGGVLFGVVEQVATVFLPQAMAPIVGFSILILAIFLRPAGLFGRVAMR